MTFREESSRGKKKTRRRWWRACELRWFVILTKRRHNESYKCIDLFYLVGVFSCFKCIMTLLSASRNKLLPLALTNNRFSFDASQNLLTDSCNVSNELSTLLTSQDFAVFTMASKVHSCPRVQAQSKEDPHCLWVLVNWPWVSPCLLKTTV